MMRALLADGGEAVLSTPMEVPTDTEYSVRLAPAGATDP